VGIYSAGLEEEDVLSSVGVSPQCTPGHPEISAHSRQVPEVDYESDRFLFALLSRGQ